MNEEIEACYRLLEVSLDASPEVVKQAYGELIKVWHPDRFPADLKFQRRANEKAREINIAYRKIIAFQSGDYVRCDPQASASKPGDAERAKASEDEQKREQARTRAEEKRSEQDAAKQQHSSQPQASGASSGHTPPRNPSEKVNPETIRSVFIWLRWVWVPLLLIFALSLILTSSWGDRLWRTQTRVEATRSGIEIKPSQGSGTDFRERLEPVLDSSSPSGIPRKAEVISEPEAHYFVFGPNSSSISFTGSKITRSHNGGFRNFAGQFKLIDGQLANAGTKVVIDTSSVWADDPRLTAHLKSSDFFDPAQFPTATFLSTRFVQEGTNTFVMGDFTLHGITKSITFPIRVQASENSVNVTAVFALNRQDYGVLYPGMANDLIRNAVVLRLNVKAVTGKADFATLQQAAQVGGTAIPAMPRLRPDP